MSILEIPECAFLHECENPETLKLYERRKGDELDHAWYCDEAAEQARHDGFSLARKPPFGGLPSSSTATKRNRW